MSCPYFEPTEPLEDSGGKYSMLPLGGAWSGICRAVDGQPSATLDAAARFVCNLGYARGRCPRFPDNEGPDAVRFTIAASVGDTLTLLYAVERNHHPHAHGSLTLRAGAGPGGELLECQARAYAESYWRRTRAAAS